MIPVKSTTQLTNKFEVGNSKLTFVFDNGSMQELLLNEIVLKSFEDKKDNPNKFAFEWANDLRGNVKEMFYS